MPPPGQLRVRLRVANDSLPRLLITWTRNGERIPLAAGRRDHEYAFSALAPAGIEGGSAVALVTLLEDVVRLLRERAPLAGVSPSGPAPGQ